MIFGKDLKDGEFCPLVRGECVRHKCAFFTKVIGLDPQGGPPIDRFGCAVAWLPVLMIENSQQQRQTASEVSKVANQIHRQRSEFVGALPEEAKARLVKSDVKVLDSSAPK